MPTMDYIFHEKQDGALCAQHCLNALLQSHYYTAVDLADIGQNLDEHERIQMAEAGTDSNEYKQFLKKPSNNYDDSGYFSIQVLQKALHVWGLELIPFSSTHGHAVAARDDPVTQYAYICNFKDHWFAIRKIGLQWFNLNSLLSGPELISNTYLMLFLTQLQQEGYSIFVVIGDLQPCYADQILRLSPAIQKAKPSLISESNNKVNEFTDDSLQRVLKESERLANEEELDYALKISLLDEPSKDCNAPSADEVRRNRAVFLERMENSNTKLNQNTQTSDQTDVILSEHNCLHLGDSSNEERMLEAAIELSMQVSK